MYPTACAPASRPFPPSLGQPLSSRSVQLPLPYQQPESKLAEYPRQRSLQFTGLRTPPSDDMGTAYQAPNVAPYDNHHLGLPSYSAALSQVDKSRTALTEAQSVLHSYPRYSGQTQQPLPQPQSRNALIASSAINQPSSRHSTRPSTPVSSQTTHTIAPHSGSATSRRGSSSLTMHSLKLPRCLDPDEGDLSDFAAQVTCLFWFEASKTLKAAESIRQQSPLTPTPRLADDAIPSPQFTKWVDTVLRTTQVTQNVVLLALMFIYRLKMTNPQVKGRPGSEYRLLTVALMLGNKFLDDNTYTNKTWAEVSGISVQEIHVMEVEFLSNMRYSLLASKEEWEEWLLKLADYFELCKRAKEPLPRGPTSPLLGLSPAHRATLTSPLPSPTDNLQYAPYVQATPPNGSRTWSPLGAHYANDSNSDNNAVAGQNWPAPYGGQPVVSPLAARPDLGNRKRSLIMEEDIVEPPAKRASRYQPGQLSQGGMARPAISEPIRLPVPNLTLNTSQVVPTTQAPYTPTPIYPPQQQQPLQPQAASSLSLPPLVPGVRAMATVFPPPATTWASQLPVLATSGPAVMPSAAGTPTGLPQHPAVLYPASTPTYGTPTKRQSPIHNLTPGYGTASPLAENFPSLSGIHTPISHSPSFYLQQRSSPYRPIRNVKTLLYPPPSASLQEYHLSGTAIPPTQMHYQPLGRRNELHTGIVPEFQDQLLLGGLGRHHALTPGRPLPNQPQRPTPLGQGHYLN